MRYYPDGEFEHRSFAEFIREHRLYHALLRIRFFGKFRLWKPFLNWRHRVIRKKFLQSRRRLQPLLYRSVPFLNGIASYGSRCCYDVSLLRIVDVRSGSPYELSDLLTQMQSTFSKGKEQLRAIVQQMKLKLSSDCEGENLILLSELPSMKMNRRGGGELQFRRR